MLFNNHTANKAENTANAAKMLVRCYNYKEIHKELLPDDYGTDVQKSLVDKGCALIADNGSVKTFTGIQGYAYVVLIEQVEIDYLIFCENEHAYIGWMRKYSMLAHLIEKFIPAS